MKKTEELRQEVDKLENTVKNAVEKFYDEVGMCDISIDVGRVFLDTAIKKQLLNTDVKVKIRL